MNKATILIVEDEVIVAADLSNKLTQLGYQVIGSTAHGEEAVDLARDRRPDLILMDIRLAGAMDGVEAAERIRRQCDLPVIFLTAHSDQATLQRAKQSEPFGYILKPFEKIELETHIEMALYKHHVDRRLRASEERYRLLFDRNPDGVFTVDSRGRFQIANPACETISGYSVDELLGMTFMELCTPDQLNPTVKQFEYSLRTLSTQQLETSITHKDGRRVEVWVTAEPIISEDRSVAMHCTAKDITERKQAEDARRFLIQCGATSSEDFFRELARYLSQSLGMDYVCIDRLQEGSLAAQTEAVYFNDKFEDNLCYTLQDTPCGAVVGKSICCFPRDVRHLFPKDAVLQEMRAESYVGTTLWSSQGQPIGLIAVIGRQPLTEPNLAQSILQVVAMRAAGELERRQAEEALRESEAALRQANEELLALNETLEARVAARTADLEQRTLQLRALAGQLTLAEERERRRISQVLHDHLQQLLVGARLHLQYLIARHKTDPLHQMLLKVENLIVESINTGRLLTAELSPMVLYQFGLGAALKWLGQWCAEKYGLTVRVDTEPEAEVEAEDVRVALYQSVRELLFNVAKHAQVKDARVSMGRMENGTLRIVVSDQGQGFEPTKVRANEGASGGFGLFSLRERLELLGADLKIESAPGSGSRFIVTVPPSASVPLAAPEPAVAATSVAEPGPTAVGRKIRIMLADDHMVVLDGLTRALNDEPDFEVLGQATNGLHALEMARQLQPDVILMDVAMPTMSGIEATRQLTSELPRIKVIALSMHDDEPHGEAMSQAGAVDFLDKNGPFADVVAAIRKHAGQALTPTPLANKQVNNEG